MGESRPKHTMEGNLWPGMKLRVQNLRRTTKEMNGVLLKERIQLTSVQELVYIYISSLNRMKMQ